MFPEQLGGEAVDGLDGGLVQFGDGLADVSAVVGRQVRGQEVVGVVGVVVVQELFQAGADAFGQLGGGGFGEGDGDDAGHWVAGFDQGDGAAHQGVGFAGAGAGLNDEVGVEVVDDALGGVGIVGGRGRGHCRCHPYMDMAALPPRLL